MDTLTKLKILGEGAAQEQVVAKRALPFLLLMGKKTSAKNPPGEQQSDLFTPPLACGT
jgi:hypothetical protein